MRLLIWSYLLLTLYFLVLVSSKPVQLETSNGIDENLNDQINSDHKPDDNYYYYYYYYDDQNDTTTTHDDNINNNIMPDVSDKYDNGKPTIPPAQNEAHSKFTTTMKPNQSHAVGKPSVPVYPTKAEPTQHPDVHTEHDPNHENAPKPNQDEHDNGKPSKYVPKPDNSHILTTPTQPEESANYNINVNIIVGESLDHDAMVHIGTQKPNTSSHPTHVSDGKLSNDDDDDSMQDKPIKDDDDDSMQAKPIKDDADNEGQSKGEEMDNDEPYINDQMVTDNESNVHDEAIDEESISGDKPNKPLFYSDKDEESINDHKPNKPLSDSSDNTLDKDEDEYSGYYYYYYYNDEDINDREI